MPLLSWKDGKVIATKPSLKTLTANTASSPTSACEFSNKEKQSVAVSVSPNPVCSKNLEILWASEKDVDSYLPPHNERKEHETSKKIDLTITVIARGNNRDATRF